VAFVEAVSGDNVTISEANWASPPNGLYNGARTLTKRQIAIRSGYTLNGNIYVGGTPPPAKFQLGDRVLDGSPIASVPNSALATEAEIDFPALYTFTAIAQDDLGGTTWATQEVAVMSWPLHWIIPAGFRTNGAFKLCMLGEAGRSYQVLGSDDLSPTNWVVIGFMEATNGIWRHWDTGAMNHARRFYRAEQVP
jgi:hypothetical protein